MWAGERSGSLIWILLNSLKDHATGWQLVRQLVWLLKIGNWCPFGFWHYNDIDRGGVSVDIVPLYLTEIFGMWSLFWGSRIWIGDNLASPPPSINRLSPSRRSSLCHLLWKVLSLDSSFVILPSHHVSFSPLYQIEKEKVERIVGPRVHFPILFWWSQTTWSYLVLIKFKCLSFLGSKDSLFYFSS